MAKTLVTELMNCFCTQIWQFCPCSHQLPNGKLCGIAKALHTTGHYGQKTGDHEGPSPPTDLTSKVAKYLQTLSQMDPIERTNKSLDFFCKAMQRKSHDERQSFVEEWIPFCLVCLRRFTRNRLVRLMQCSHALCSKCVSGGEEELFVQSMKRNLKSLTSTIKFLTQQASEFCLSMAAVFEASFQFLF